MPHLFYGERTGEYVELDERETHHLRVVRRKIGETIKVTDGKGFLHICELIEIGKERSRALLKESKVVEVPNEKTLTICIASENWDRLRWLVEKSVEIGVDEIVVYKAERSRSYVNKRDKLEIIVREAAKQCERFLFPKLTVSDALNLEKLCGKVIVLYKTGRPAVLEDFKAPVSIIVGPEGDFEEEELKNLSSRGQLLSLGKKILRFETAAFLSLSIAGFVNSRI